MDYIQCGTFTVNVPGLSFYGTGSPGRAICFFFLFFFLLPRAHRTKWKRKLNDRAERSARMTRRKGGWRFLRQVFHRGRRWPPQGTLPSFFSSLCGGRQALKRISASEQWGLCFSFCIGVLTTSFAPPAVQFFFVLPEEFPKCQSG